MYLCVGVLLSVGENVDVRVFDFVFVFCTCGGVCVCVCFRVSACEVFGCFGCFLFSVFLYLCTSKHVCVLFVYVCL